MGLESSSRGVNPLENAQLGEPDAVGGVSVPELGPEIFDVFATHPSPQCCWGQFAMVLFCYIRHAISCRAVRALAELSWPRGPLHLMRDGRKRHQPALSPGTRDTKGAAGHGNSAPSWTA
jgi:hypothetical protein